jgi:hypothetical protein
MLKLERESRARKQYQKDQLKRTRPLEKRAMKEDAEMVYDNYRDSSEELSSQDPIYDRITEYTHTD